MTQLNLSLIIVTYNRPQVIRRTLRALHYHLHLTKLDNSQIILADDWSPNDYAESVTEWAAAELGWSLEINRPATIRGGWGRNVNSAITWARYPNMMIVEDDYLLTHDIDLHQHIKLLNHPDVGMVRLDGIVGHVGLRTELRECLMNDYQFTGMLPRHYPYWNLLPSSNHLNVYSNRPHLFNRQFLADYGLYPEGKPLGDTEEQYAGHVLHVMRSRKDAPQIVAPVELTACYWEHIGNSYQGSEHDVS